MFKEPEKEDKIVSRFLAKVALETLALKFESSDEWIEEITTKSELDLIRHYARYGDKPIKWEYNQRRIYEESDRFYNPLIAQEPYEILHEMDVFFLQEGELYLVLVLMGIEYVIHLTNPEISGYKRWLQLNGERSPIELNQSRIKIKEGESLQEKINKLHKNERN